MIEVRTPQTHPNLGYANIHFDYAIFLAGSIEMGTAENWQAELIEYLKENVSQYKNLVIFNPRRDDWDSTWTQSIDDKKFRHQVEWELHHLQNVTFPVFYFAPGTMSPITLLELGLVVGSCTSNSFHPDPIVYCPKEYLRSGNVQITLARMRIGVEPFYEDKLEFFDEIVYQINHSKN